MLHSMLLLDFNFEIYKCFENTKFHEISFTAAVNKLLITSVNRIIIKVMQWKGI